MTILNLFIDFINTIFSIKILDIELIDYLFGFTIIIIIFKIISILGNKKGE